MDIMDKVIRKNDFERSVRACYDSLKWWPFNFNPFRRGSRWSAFRSFLLLENKTWRAFMYSMNLMTFDELLRRLAELKQAKRSLKDFKKETGI